MIPFLTDRSPDVSERNICYHRKRHASAEYAGTMVFSKVRCSDCGAEVSASYGSPLPDMPPMPFPADDEPSPPVGDPE